MASGFVIMQIGDPELDHLFETAICPAIIEASLEPKRVDRHNEGGLLKSEIIRFINESEIIVADLTNERPNVYLEIGYAMGVDKFRNLILTSRDDHLPGVEGWNSNGPKVHFDLAGYDILLWHPNELNAFRHELVRRIRRRMALTAPTAKTEAPTIDDGWVASHRGVASAAMAEHGIEAYMEIRFGIAAPKPDHSPSELLEAAESAMIRTFGWPIGVVLHVERHKPRPRADGIVAEIRRDATADLGYDYWALRRNGDFYLRKSLFEDKRNPHAIFFNTRIVRTTEVLLYALRLYDRLGVDRSSDFSLELEYGGFKGRYLSQSSDRMMTFNPVADEDSIITAYHGSLQEVEATLTEVVKSLTAPFLTLFDFYELSDSIYESIVSAYVAGRVT